MAKIIKVGSQNLTPNKIANPFRTSRNSTTNPFKYSNFQGNTLPFEYADVFGGAKSNTNKLRMIASSVAGSMNKMKSSIAEPIINFVNRVSENISSAWQYAKVTPFTTAVSDAANASGIVRALVDHTSFGYNFVFALLIILFTYFYTAITINPTQMAEDMKRNNGFIPGIKPGKNTAEYIDTIMSRITLPGSIFLAIVAILPAFAGLFGVQAEFAQFFGGTSLLILVGVVLDTLQQVESHLLMRHYDGLLSSGRIQGRSANVAAY